MTKRESAPIGAPCWVDLWTSDVEGSRRFYAELFGWVAEQPDPEHGGYFMFTREGVPIAGGMGDMGEMRADDTWKPYLASNDIETTLRLAIEQGSKVQVPAMAVDDLGVQAIITDPQGLVTGIWQPGQLPRLHGDQRTRRADLPSCSTPMTTTAQFTFTGTCSAGTRSRRRPRTGITTPATWTPRRTAPRGHRRRGRESAARRGACLVRLLAERRRRRLGRKGAHPRRNDGRRRFGRRARLGSPVWPTPPGCGFGCASRSDSSVKTMNSTARRMFELVEPIGVIPYFADEPNEAMFALGFTNYWDLYFADGRRLWVLSRRRWWTRSSTTSLPARWLATSRRCGAPPLPNRRSPLVRWAV